MLKTIVLLVWAGILLAQQNPSPDEQLADQMKAALAEVQGLKALKAQEAASQAKLKELQKTYKDSYPGVKDLKNQLEALRQQETKAEARVASLSGAKFPLTDRWWRNPVMVTSVGLTPDQQKKMDDVFQQYRLRLVDLNAALEREEITLDPLVSAEPLDEAKITAQIDRVAQARAELEKANGRMLLGIRKLLTADQWNRVSQGYSLVPGQK